MLFPPPQFPPSLTVTQANDLTNATATQVVGLMRAIRAQAATLGIGVNCVAPWMTETGMTYPALKTALRTAGIPLQRAASVAAAMAYAASAESAWTGKTIYVADDTFTELEEGIAALEPQWLGVDNARMFRYAQTAGYYGPAKA